MVFFVTWHPVLKTSVGAPGLGLTFAPLLTSPQDESLKYAQKTGGLDSF